MPGYICILMLLVKKIVFKSTDSDSYAGYDEIIKNVTEEVIKQLKII